jgi:hypothetical protein
MPARFSRKTQLLQALCWAGIAGVCGLIGVGGLHGCAEPEAAPSDAPPFQGRIAISVAPLGYDDLTNARYTLTLRNGLGEAIWSQSNLESDDFGNGKGDLTYIGGCDLDQPDGTFELVLDALYTGNPPAELPVEDYENPCPTEAPCVQPALCSESETQVTQFSLVIVLKAEKGFLDVGIRLSDIFCSATVSCKEELLFIGGRRSKTHILGLACAAGLGTETRLYMRDLRLTCPGTPVVSLDPSGQKGNQPPIGPVGAWALYRDNEEFEGYRKGFWNIGLALAPHTPDCLLTATMTAAEGPLADRTTPIDTKYPVIEVSQRLGPADAACHPTQELDGNNSHIATRYTDFDETICFEHEADIRTVGLRLYGGLCPAP